MAATCIALGGCAALIVPVPDSAYKWEKVWEPLPMTEHIVPQAAVQAYCAHSNRYVVACAYRDHEHCWVFASSMRMLDLMREHETKHCDGWNHQVI